MLVRRFKTTDAFFGFLLSFTMVTFAFADEKIMQQEPLSFQKCLKVISTSESKLSIIPEIIDVPNEKRVAVFKLTDGILKITCDGLEETVTVSTDTN